MTSKIPHPRDYENQHTQEHPQNQWCSPMQLMLMEQSYQNQSRQLQAFMRLNDQQSNHHQEEVIPPKNSKRLFRLSHSKTSKEATSIEKIQISDYLSEGTLTNPSIDSQKSSNSADSTTQLRQKVQIDEECDQRHQPSCSQRQKDGDIDEKYLKSHQQKTKTIKKNSKSKSLISSRPGRIKNKNGRIQPLKNDYQKNAYGNAFKYIAKQFTSARYSDYFKNLCQKHDVEDHEKVREYYNWTLKFYVGINDLPFILGDLSGEGEQDKMKRAFYEFYVWFLRKRYTLHIVQDSQIINKVKYLKIKNAILYLPELHQNGKNKLLQPRSCSKTY